MRALLVLGSLLLASPALAADPTAAQAKQLASAKDWDQLYLSFSSVKPEGFSTADRTAIASALLQGAKVMSGTDAVIATSLAERAAAFHESVDGLIAAAELEQQVDQRGQAAKFLDRAVALDPKSGAAHLARAELHLKEGEGALALKQLDAVPAGFQAARVKQLRAQAQARVAERKAGEDALQQVQRQVAAREQEASRPPPAEKGKGGARMVSAVDPMEGAALAGLRERAGRHFVFAYGNNSRDWGQRAEYEGQVEAALEEAYEFVGETMHVNRSQPVAVVLYTKQEYEFHFGGSALSRAAGFFSGKIRINGAEEMTPEVKAVIVHEYTHAVLDELLQGGQHCPVWVNEGFATYVENLYRDRRGMPGADDDWHKTLRGMAILNQLPSLEQLDRSFIEFRNPRLAYATSGCAMKILVEHYGMETFVQTCRDAATKPWKALFAERFTADLSSLDDQVRSELSE